MVEAANTRLIGHIDCAGGGQVWVDGETLYVGHMRAPQGTSIYDVADPASPRLLASLEMPPGWHSHKVRAVDGLMIVNHERVGGAEVADFTGGLGIYDVTEPARPRLAAKWPTAGKGVHRYDFDGRFAYISPTVAGYVGNIVMILDLAEPASPREVGRWWAPGQWRAGGEVYPADEAALSMRCHHPLRFGDRLHVSYWHHGFFILDIADPSRPALLAEHDNGGARAHPTHSCVVLPETRDGRRAMIVAEEDVAKLWPSPPAGVTLYDVTEPAAPTPISSFQVASLAADDGPQPAMTGCHQPSERLNGPVVPFAWFAQGLRLVDLTDPAQPEEVGHYIPDPPDGFERVCSNDVTIDDRGLIYLADRQAGADIIETSVF